MKNVMYQQIEERKVLMVKNLLHFLNVDVNQNNINNMNNILTEFNKMDRYLSDNKHLKEHSKTTKIGRQLTDIYVLFDF